MKLQCEVKHIYNNCYDILFYSFEDAQKYFVRVLKEYLIKDLSLNFGLITQFNLIEHYSQQYDLIKKMPYYCENENGIKLSSFSNEVIADIKLIKE